MDKTHYREMLEKFQNLERQGTWDEKEIYLFGQCNATECLVKLFQEHGYRVAGILDNNEHKQGQAYRGVPIVSPLVLAGGDTRRTVVCIVSRAYASMAEQLHHLEFQGGIEKLVDYNPFAEYDLSSGTIERRIAKIQEGQEVLRGIREKWPGSYLIVCPFDALGDVYHTMCYLPYFLEKQHVGQYVVCLVGESCRGIAEIFGVERIARIEQRDMDGLVQAILANEEKNVFIAHHDRPYTNYLIRSLYVKRITIDILYRIGVFGLAKDTRPLRPYRFRVYDGIEAVPHGKSVILAPHAKSIANIPSSVWKQLVDKYKGMGYEVYTNVVDEETVLEGTKALSVPIAELKSVVEWAGTFIGLRSGLCDVLREADCDKTVLFPDAFYSDTPWKSSEIYYMDDWKNMIVGQDGKMREVYGNDV